MKRSKQTIERNSAILLDTQILVWFAIGRTLPSEAAAEILSSGLTDFQISAVIAYEYADLNRRGRFGVDLPLADVLEELEATVVDYPAGCWRTAAELPRHHLDPVDRMLIAHAIHADLPLITADETIRRYPVRTIW